MTNMHSSDQSQQASSSGTAEDFPTRRAASSGAADDTPNRREASSGAAEDFPAQQALFGAVQNDPGDYRARFMRTFFILQPSEKDKNPDNYSEAARDLAWIANNAATDSARRLARFFLLQLKDFIESGLENIPDYEEARNLEIELCDRLPVNIWHFPEAFHLLESALELPVPGRWLACDSILKCIGPRCEYDERRSMYHLFFAALPPESLNLSALKDLSLLLRTRSIDNNSIEECPADMELLLESLEIEQALYTKNMSTVADIFRIIRLIEKDSPDMAIKIANTLCAEMPDDDEMLFRSAMTLYENGLPSIAKNIFRLVIPMSETRRQDALFYTGLVLEKEEDILSALEYWQYLVEDDIVGFRNSAKESVIKAAREKQKFGRYTQALQILDKAAEQCSWGPEIPLEAANILLSKAKRLNSVKSYRLAMKRYRAIISRWPESHAAQLSQKEIDRIDESRILHPLSLRSPHGWLLWAAIAILMYHAFLLVIGLPTILQFAFGLAFIVVSLCLVFIGIFTNLLDTLLQRFIK